MKHLILLFIFLLSLTSYCQVTVSNLNYSTADVPSLLPTDPMKDSSFSTITFNAGNLKAGDQVHIKTGTAKGKSDLQAIDLVAIVNNGKTYLAQGSTWYPVVNGQVTIKKVIAKTNAIKSTFATIQGADANGKVYAAPGASVQQQVK